MLRVKVVLSVLCWEMLKVAPLSWPQRFTGAHRDLIEHTCCLTATNVDECARFLPCSLPQLQAWLNPVLLCWLLKCPGSLRFDD